MINKTTLRIFIAYICLIGVSLAEEEEKKTTVSLFFVAPSLGYDIHNDKKTISYSSNNPLIPKVGVQYDGYGLSYGTGSGRMTDEIPVDTTARDFQFFFYFDNFGADLYYQEYKGFYLDRQPMVDANYFRDMRVSTYTLNLYQRLGGSAPISALTKPIASSDWFNSVYYLLGGVSERMIKSDDVLIPVVDRADFPGFDNLKKYDALTVSLAGGAFFPMHYGGFYFNPGLTVGFGYPVKQFDSDIKSDYSIKVNLKGSAGYAGEHYRFGLDVTNDSDAFEFANEAAVQFHSIIITLTLIAYTF